MLYFNRSFSSTRFDVDGTQRSSSPDDFSPEGFEWEAERVEDQIDIGQIIMLDIFQNADNPGLRYTLDVDEGEPPDSNLPSEEQSVIG